MEVVIVVDRQQVPVNVGVSQHQVRPGDVVDGLQQAVELLEASGAAPLQGEAAVLCIKLERGASMRDVARSMNHI